MGGGRRRATWLAPAYDVERYLEHQAEIFLERFDPYSYLYLTRIMDAFDPFGSEPVALDPRRARWWCPSTATGASGPSTRARWRRGCAPAG